MSQIVQAVHSTPGIGQFFSQKTPLTDVKVENRKRLCLVQFCRFL
jgi:hypothetical protein